MKEFDEYLRTEKGKRIILTALEENKVSTTFPLEGAYQKLSSSLAAIWKDDPSCSSIPKDSLSLFLEVSQARSLHILAQQKPTYPIKFDALQSQKYDQDDLYMCPSCKKLPVLSIDSFKFAFNCSCMSNRDESNIFKALKSWNLIVTDSKTNSSEVKS